jgi:signal transduction histidine kinase
MNYRTQSVLWYAAPVILAIVLLSGISVYHATSSYYTRTDSFLQSTAQHMLRNAALSDAPGSVSHNDFLFSGLSIFIKKTELHILSSEGSIPIDDIPGLFLSASKQHDAPHSKKISGTLRRLLFVTDGYIDILVVQSVDDLVVMRRRMLLGTVIGGILVLLGTVAIGRFFSRRTSRMIDNIIEYTGKLERQPLTKQLPGLGTLDDPDLQKVADGFTRALDTIRQNIHQVHSYTSLTSHELRTPLAIIRNQLEDAMRRDVPAKRLRIIVASAYDEIIRLNHIVNDLLTVSTLQAGTMRLEIVDVALHHFLKEFYDEALILSREKNISVVMAKGPQVTIRADVIRLRQLFFNLLDNAIKNTDQQGRIHLKYEVEDGGVMISFSDNGRGIPQQHLERIFDSFYRGDVEYSQIQEGAGLGLSLVRWIVEAHNGTIDVQSQVGEGTTFRITLPAVGSPK